MFKISDILAGFDYEFNLADKPNIYAESLTRIKSFSKDILNRKLNKERTEQFFNEFLQDFFTHEDIFLNCFFHVQGSKDFLSSHILNTMFLSYAVGNWIELEDENLLKLITISFFLNISLMRMDNILKRKEMFNNDEKETAGYYSNHSAQIFEAIYPEEKEISVFIKNHHNYDFKDNNAANNELKKLFNIILLSDNFETIIHRRPYSKVLKPNEAVRKIIKEFSNVEKEALKKFVDYVGIYPITTLTKLNTGEKAVVVSQNKGFPLRPKVKILDKHSSKKDKILNLLIEKDIFIEKVL